MNLRQLEYFVVIAEEGSLTAAAERLLVAQPSLSQQMRALEAEIGVPLLERLPRGVRPTPAGERFLPEAQAALEHADRARRSARMAWDLSGGELHIATIPSVAAGLLPEALGRWRQRYPGVELSLREFVHRRTMDDAVRDGYGDLAVGLVPHDWAGPVQQLGWEELVVVLPRDDELLARRRIALEELSDRSWVHFVRDHGLAQIADATFAASGFAPRIAIRTGQVATAPVLAAAGLGPALVPDTIVPESLLALARPLRPRRARRIVAFSRLATPAAEAFIDVLREHEWKPRPRDCVELP
ncbi:MAG TPA: LysR family transcriptional regulator [Baekduia sp.]|nr:LysR family transcriptional regulator [Baekduia sp.]